VKYVPGLIHSEDGAIGMIRGFRAVHGLVQMRIERLTQRVNPLRAESRQMLEKLLVNQLKAFAIVFVLGLAMRR